MHDRAKDRFGSVQSELPGHGDVDMALDPWIYEKVPSLGGYTEEDETMIHYTVTEHCAFRCAGCINALTAGKGDSDRTTYTPAPRREEDLERDIRGMAHLLRSSGRQRGVVVFYGGEPMLRLEKMDRVYRRLKKLVDGQLAVKFAVITSGHFLEKMVERFPDLAAEIALTAVSVDGTEAQHDSVRLGTSLREIRRQLCSLQSCSKGRCARLVHHAPRHVPSGLLQILRPSPKPWRGGTLLLALG